MGYTSSDISNLNGFINNAIAAKAANNFTSEQAALDQYYQYQIIGNPNNSSIGRGYAGLAQQVVDNSSLFGATANQNVIDDIGQSQYNIDRPALTLDLAEGEIR